MSTAYDLIIKCTKTGIEEVLEGPHYSLKKINNEKDLYSRHLFSGAALVIVERDEKTRPLSRMDKLNLDDTEHNPFDAKFKEPTHSSIYIPKDENDSRDAAWLITADQKEKEYALGRFYSTSINAYNNNKHIKPCVDLIGSFWHKGFVNSMFAKTHASYEMRGVCEWIDIIGNKYDAKLIASLSKPKYSYNGIYKNGFFQTEVKNLCEYCSQIFGVSKYDVAKHFAKRDISEFDTNSQSHSTKVSNLWDIGNIYAEMGEVELANEYYIQAIDNVDETFWGDRDWKQRMVNKYAEFVHYVQDNGTSIFSS